MKDFKDIKIAVAGTGYVGLSIATLLSQHHHVTAVDVISEKVEKLNNRISPIQDEYIEKYLAEKPLNLVATLDGKAAYKDADFVVIAAPTNYDPVKNYFDTTHVEEVIDLVLEVNPDAVMVIKSTIPVGYTRSLYLKYAKKGVKQLNLLFSPEFLRESKALYDNLYPSRIIVGYPKLIDGESYAEENEAIRTITDVERMKEGQKYIYFASGDTVEAIDHMPQTELLKDHSMEILYFTDKADEFLSDILHTYQDKPFRSAIDGDLELGDEQKPDETEHYKESFGFIKEVLGDRVDTVKASTKLKTHPVCLTSGEGVTFEMEKYFTAVQPELGLKAKRILELNVDHPAFMALETARVLDPERAKKYAEILYNQALLIAGLPIENPSAYTDLLCSLWK